MFAILRQYELALWVIVSRPSTRFHLGLGLLLIGPALAPWLAGRAAPDGFMTEVSVVETSAGFGGFDVAAFEKMAREGRLGSVALAQLGLQAHALQVFAHPQQALRVCI